ncbi:cupin domain-containing protein [Paraliomyxa miuraensis]|uniref:hypothetical protein n=1 Tax=Paraliomyxa miuraensis TaxID=376150 RepID=UPI00225810FA|nr:hypothetical protein [Paraliomyxa miuraensis]MCX4240200.1 hypothetical protein [Paraliomyxa miuraensis]
MSQIHHEHRDPRLGTAYVSRRTAPGAEVFGVVSDDGTAAGLRPITTRVGSWSSECPTGEHLWMVGSTVQEALRWSPAPAGPAGVSGLDPSRRSVMRLRITTTDSARGTTYEIDLGQSLELYAEALQVELWAPQGAVLLGTQQPVAPQQGLLFESQALVRMMRLEVSRGACCALLTDSFYIPAGQPHVQRVPAGARRLTAYPSALGLGSMWWWLRGDPATVAVPLGLVAWSSDRPRMEIDVPSAAHLRIDPAAVARLFTIVWTITP